MKNSQQIISSLQNEPRFKKLSNVRCIKKIQGLFPPHLQKMIIYGYIQNKTIYFVFSHPWAKQEFHNIIESIKTPLKNFTPNECKEINFQDIKAYVSHKPYKNSTLYVGSSTAMSFKERAKAKFSNNVKDKNLYNIIEDIRKILDDRKN